MLRNEINLVKECDNNILIIMRFQIEVLRGSSVPHEFAGALKALEDYFIIHRHFDCLH